MRLASHLVLNNATYFYLLYIHKNRGCRDDILGLFFVFTDVPIFVFTDVPFFVSQKLSENPKENQYGGKEKE